jgi:hypothetical protein
VRPWGVTALAMVRLLYAACAVDVQAMTLVLMACVLPARVLYVAPSRIIVVVQVMQFALVALVPAEDQCLAAVRGVVLQFLMGNAIVLAM